MTSVAKRPLTGKHILSAMIAFFVSVTAVNGYFIYTALRTFPGEDVRRSYLQGLNYNETLSERRAQAALNWRAEVGIIAQANGAAVEVRVVNREGASIEGLLITGVLRRPADSDHDVPLTFVARGKDIYVAHTPHLAPGAWDVRATAERGAERFSFVRRQMWTPPSH